MVNIVDANEDALTHGVYVSEVSDEFKATYAQYLREQGRDDLIDIPVGSP